MLEAKSLIFTVIYLNTELINRRTLKSTVKMYSWNFTLRLNPRLPLIAERCV